METALSTTIMNTPTEGVPFRRLVFIPPIQNQRSVVFITRSGEAVLVAHGGKTTH